MECPAQNAEVAPELPAILNHFRRASRAESVDRDGADWASVDAEGTAILLSAGDGAEPQRYRVISSMLMVLGLLRNLLDAATEFGAETMGVSPPLCFG